MNFIKNTTLAAAIMTSLAVSTAFAQTVTIKSFVAQPEHFGVTSTLIENDKEVMLVNAQFSKSEALRLTAEILDSGKTLNTIFISYGDPDYYFGLDVLKQYFPAAKILATPETVQHIQQTQALKVNYWSPLMGANAPSKIIVPEIYRAKTLKLGDQKIEIKGKNELTYLYIPDARAVVGGIAVSSGIHLWMADTPRTQDRQAVLETLSSIQALHPKVVIPAHMAAHAPQDLAAVNFSINYIKDYEKAVQASKTSADVIQIMQQQYPTLTENSNLELGAKVVKGEMKWP
jgi:glyoxylase-like metal-dependent hydrolase (beta-lactamase superfamily II)